VTRHVARVAAMARRWARGTLIDDAPPPRHRRDASQHSGVAAASREDGAARTTGYDNIYQETLRDAPSGWTCSSSALRFRVDTAGPVSSLTMVPRSPAGGFVVTSRGVRVGGFPQPFCNERPVSDACVCREHRCVFISAFTLGLLLCILKHAPRPAFAVITLRAAAFRARNFARIFSVMGASDAALKLADRGGTGRVAGLVYTLLHTEG
jgi:hypothetical protein